MCWCGGRGEGKRVEKLLRGVGPGGQVYDSSPMRGSGGIAGEHIWTSCDNNAESG